MAKNERMVAMAKRLGQMRAYAAHHKVPFEAAKYAFRENDGAVPPDPVTVSDTERHITVKNAAIVIRNQGESGVAILTLRVGTPSEADRQFGQPHHGHDNQEFTNPGTV